MAKRTVFIPSALMAASIIALIPIFVSLRGATPDTIIYKNIYHSIEDVIVGNPISFYISTGIEWGFGLFAFLFKIIQAPLPLFFYAVSFFTFAAIYLSGKALKLRKNILLLIYIASSHFWMLQFMQIRQGLAVAISYFAIIQYNKNRSRGQFVLLAIVGISFHQSVLAIFAFFVAFRLLKLHLVSYRNFIFKSFGLLLFLIIFFDLFLLNVLVSTVPRLALYKASSNFGASVSVLNPATVRVALITLFCYALSNFSHKNNLNFRVLLYFMVVALGCRIGFSDFAILSGRLSTLFSFSEVFLLSYILTYRFSVTGSAIISTVFCLSNAYLVLSLQAKMIVDTYALSL